MPERSICLCLIHFWVNPFFQFPAPADSSLWGNKKREPQYKDQEGGNLLEQNQLNRLQMVQFECPKYRNPCISFTFAFPAIGPDCISWLPRFTSVLGNGHTMLKTPVLVRSLKLSNIGPG